MDGVVTYSPARVFPSLVPRLVLLLMCIAASASSAAPPAFRILIGETGVYRVSFEDLVASDLSADSVRSSGLCLFQRGETVPIWVADGGDGDFGPGDWFEFVGERLTEDGRFHHDYSPWNVYWLRLGRSFSHRMKARAPVSAVTEDAARLSLRTERHLEEDRLLVRLGGFEIEQASRPELWYWAKLTHLDPKPFSVSLDFSDLDQTASASATLRLRFFGLSYRAGFVESSVPDHRVDVSLNGRYLASAEWDGRKDYLLDLPPLAMSSLIVGDNELSLSVPARTGDDQEGPQVDVVMLDWVEVQYPRVGVIASPRAKFRVAVPARGDSSSLGQVNLTALQTSSLVAYGNRGSRIEISGRASSGQNEGASASRLIFEPADTEDVYHAVVDRQLLSPIRIQRDRPSRLKAMDRFGDYLMIAHASLLDAVAPLADFHRRRGLRVVLVDVQDVYDEFNHGIVHPRAIRDFIDHAYRRWLKPAPRFVLLVGDASWDTKNATVDDANYANWTTQQLLGGNRFRPKRTEVYEKDPTSNRRNLIPTWNYHSYQGHSASDNRFVALREQDHLPVMAIGRLPVTEPAEVAAIVEKTIRYVLEPQVGPWRRQSLWITNEELGYQQVSDQLASQAAERGLGLHKVYPRSQEAGNAAHQARLRQAFDDGQYLVHFFGHGGRFIWRTGPPDLKKNHDLFTLDDLDQLEPTGRLAIVLSMTCHSAPFDHPNADSIGEKFLRLPARGAVGVLAASWRTQPSSEFSQALVDELTQPGSLGEAILRAKQRVKDPVQVEQYNLLGDPAVPLAVPRLKVGLTPAWSIAGDLSVETSVDVPAFEGQALVDWLDEADETLFSQEQSIDQSRFTVTFGGDPEEVSAVRSVRVYVWNESAGLDGVARRAIDPAP